MTAPPRLSRRENTVLFVLIVCMAALEVAMQASDFLGLFSGHLRQTVYDYGGFWPGLLRDWQPNYLIQPYLMFLTYGFVHGNILHLIVNMFTAWSVGRVVLDRRGVSGFLQIWVASILGGGIGYALLADGLQPMVGASGALFGLIGALFFWEYRDRRAAAASLRPLAWGLVGFLILNLLLWWLMDGHLAWEAHLGGFVAGAALATGFD